MQIASKIRKTSPIPIPMPALAPVLRPLEDEGAAEAPGWRGMTEMVAVWVTGAGGEVEDDEFSEEESGEDGGCVSSADGVGVGVADGVEIEGVGVGVADGVEVGGVGVEEWDVVNDCCGVEVVTVGVEDVTTGTTAGLEVVEETTDGAGGGMEVVLIVTAGHCDVQSVVPAQSNNDAEAQQAPVRGNVSWEVLGHWGERWAGGLTIKSYETSSTASCHRSRRCGSPDNRSGS